MKSVYSNFLLQWALNPTFLPQLAQLQAFSANRPVPPVSPSSKDTNGSAANAPSLGLTGMSPKELDLLRPGSPKVRRSRVILILRDKMKCTVRFGN